MDNIKLYWHIPLSKLDFLTCLQCLSLSPMFILLFIFWYLCISRISESPICLSFVWAYRERLGFSEKANPSQFNVSFRQASGVESLLFSIWLPRIWSIDVPVWALTFLIFKIQFITFPYIVFLKIKGICLGRVIYTVGQWVATLILIMRWSMFVRNAEDNVFVCFLGFFLFLCFVLFCLMTLQCIREIQLSVEHFPWS